MQMSNLTQTRSMMSGLIVQGRKFMKGTVVEVIEAASDGHYPTRCRKNGGAVGPSDARCLACQSVGSAFDRKKVVVVHSGLMLKGAVPGGC